MVIAQELNTRARKSAQARSLIAPFTEATTQKIFATKHAIRRK
jgi:phosphotransferase system IIA component